MKKITFRDERYPNDITRIVEICKKRDYEISRHDAQMVWFKHSEVFAAGWLILDEDDESIFQTIMSYCNNEENDK